MSELTELLADQNVPSAVYDALDRVRELLPEHDAHVADQARKEALDAALAVFALGGENRAKIRAAFACRWPEEFSA